MRLACLCLDLSWDFPSPKLPRKKKTVTFLKMLIFHSKMKGFCKQTLKLHLKRNAKCTLVDLALRFKYIFLDFFEKSFFWVEIQHFHFFFFFVRGSFGLEKFQNRSKHIRVSLTGGNSFSVTYTRNPHGGNSHKESLIERVAEEIALNVLRRKHNKTL